MTKDMREMWSADFQCHCGSLITVRTWLAVIQGPGLEMACRACRLKYLITESGATPITDDVERAFIDAEGKPYRPYIEDEHIPPPNFPD